MENSPSFPPEIFREILLKVGTFKSLLRCKSVCKEWYSLISDQDFIKTHYTSLSSTKFLFSTLEQTDSVNSCPLNDVLFHKSFSNALVLENPLQLPRPYDFRIVGSCNGLLCLVEEVEDGKEDDVFIYNPATRRLNCMPIESVSSSGFYSLGFGYDEVSNDYKVVIIETGCNLATRILSLNSGEWKEGGQFPCACPNGDGKLLNGAIHWAAGNESWKIISFDLANETYGEVLQPEYHEGSHYLELGISGDSLCVLCNDAEKFVATVWMMKVYGVKDSWTMVASFLYPYTWLERVLAPFYISEDGKLMFKFGRRLVVYDSKDSSSSVIGNFLQCLEACTAVESLVSPFGLTSDDEDQGNGKLSKSFTYVDAIEEILKLRTFIEL